MHISVRPSPPLIKIPQKIQNMQTSFLKLQKEKAANISKWLIAALAIPAVASAVAGSTAKIARASSVSDQLSQTQQEVAKLFQLKDQSGIPDQQKQQLEIDIKKKIITDVIGVAKTQIDALRQSVQQAPFPKTEDWQRVFDQFNATLDADEAYYQTVQDAIDTKPSISNDDISALASAIQERKKASIDPDLRHIQTILATFNVSDILSITDAREQKIGTDIDKVYAKNLTKNPSLRDAYAQARDLIADAHHSNDRAQSITITLYADQNDSSTRALMQDILKEVTAWEATTSSSTQDTSTTMLQSDKTPTDQGGATSTPQIIAPSRVHPYIEALIVRSLTDIKKAYGIFTQMSQNVQKYF